MPTHYYRLLTPLAAAVAAFSAQQALADTVNLDAVTVVSAAGFEQNIKDAPASISVISQEELQKKAYNDVTDALKDIPGVLITGGGSSSDISLRGMGGQYTMILIDGKPMDSRQTRPNSDGAGIEQGWTPPVEAIERIEVIRGPMSSLYGSDAMGGIINIITKKVSDTWHGSVRSDATLQETAKSGNILQNSFYLSGPLVDNKWGLQLSGNNSRRQEDNIPKGFANQKTDDIRAKLTYTPTANHDVTVEASRSEQERNAHIGKSVAPGPRASNSETPYTREQLAISHNARWNNALTESYVQYENTNNPVREMEVSNTIAKSQTSFFAGKHTATLGGQYKYENLTDNGNELQSRADLRRLTRWGYALFAEDEWMLTDDFSLTGGIRYDKDENFGDHWTPRLFGVWQTTDYWTIKGGVSSGYRTPNIRATVADWGQATGGAGGNAVILGNPDLKPETSISTELGTFWDNLNGLSIGATVFQTRFDDKITEYRECTENGPGSDTNGECIKDGHAFDYISSRTNVDKAEMRGVETTFDWEITPTVNLAANYTYTETEQKSGEQKGKPLNQIPKHMVNVSVDYRATDKLGTWTRVNYRGKTTEYLSRVSMADGTSSYAFLDAGLTYQAQPHWQVRAGIYNIADKQVRDETHGTTLDGRRYVIGTTINF